MKNLHSGMMCRLLRAGVIAAAMTAATAAAAVENVANVAVALSGGTYVKVLADAGALKELSLTGITAWNGAAQVAFACVSNRPCASSSATQPGLPSGEFVYQLSVFNAWSGTRTYSYRVQLAQPTGTEDLYARVTAVTISKEGVNLVDHPDIRNIMNERALIEYTYTSADAELANYSVSALKLSAAPYIESLGTSGISTGYRMKGGISRVEVDFALTTVEPSKYIFGASSSLEGVFQTFYYLTADPGFKFGVRPKSPAGENEDYLLVVNNAGTSDTERHVAIIDLHNKKHIEYKNGSLRFSHSFIHGNDFAGYTAAMPLSLFANYVNTASAMEFTASSKAKIYGVRIYENYDESAADNSANLVHHFVPCLKDGETPCFKDLVGGGFIAPENAAAFTAGGDLPTYQDNAYVSTAANAEGGKLYINTGCKITDDTTVELDCALAAKMPTASADSSNWFLFDCNNAARFSMGYLAGSTSGKMYYLQFTAGGNGTAVFDGALFTKPSSDNAINMRRTFILDNYRTCAAVVTAGFTNRVVTFSRKTNSGNSGDLALASYYGGAATYRTPLKIYGCKIYESGELAHDFKPYVRNGVPGLLDDKTGNFVVGVDSSGSGNILAYGGEIDGEGDADSYIESNGSTGMSSGYKMKGNISRVEVDYSLTDVNANSTRIFGDITMEKTVKTMFYFTGSAGQTGGLYTYRISAKSGSAHDVQYHSNGVSTIPMDAARRTLVTDLKSGKCQVNEGSSVNSKNVASYSTFASDFNGLEADLPLSLYASYNNASGTTFANCAKARIYSVRFYENYVEGGSNTPVRELIPYSRDGVVGFYDTVTGEIVKNDDAAAGAFTFGGAGMDNGAFNCYIKPGYTAKIDNGESTTLTAYAPGAVSYRWLCDGEPIYGGTDGTLTVPWSRSGEVAADGFRHHSYQAVAVFEVYGTTREGAASAVVDILSRPLGMTIIIR